MDGKEAEEYLEALGAILARESEEPLDIMVCGGMALILQGLIDRRTRDIDGMALVVMENDAYVLKKPLLKKPLKDAIQRVAAVYGITRHWLSFQSRTLLDNGLPEGIIERAEVRHYGEKLTVRLISRYDQVHLKLKAAISREGPDAGDIAEIGATEKEIAAAARWCLELGYSSADIKEALEMIGHGEIAERIG